MQIKLKSKINSVRTNGNGLNNRARPFCKDKCNDSFNKRAYNNKSYGRGGVYVQ